MSRELTILVPPPHTKAYAATELEVWKNQKTFDKIDKLIRYEFRPKEWIHTKIHNSYCRRNRDMYGDLLAWYCPHDVARCLDRYGNSVDSAVYAYLMAMSGDHHVICWWR